ncbi:MAG TPA: ABC transporter permease [Gemmatimonadaceae bacterium]
MVNPRLALRTLFRTPFVTLVTVLSLALGIGANAAIFSFFNQILLRPLPVRDAGDLINLSAPGPKPGSQSCNQSGSCEDVFSYPMFRDLEEKQNVLVGLAAHRTFGANLAYKGNTSSAQGALVSGSYFPVLGLRPAAGRLLTPEDDRTIGGHFVAVLAYSYWETQFGLDPAVINDVITINGQSMTVVGVAPKGFEGVTLGDLPRVFVPITMRGLMSPGFRSFENRRSYWAYVFGRLKPGVTREQASMALNALYKPILSDVEAPLQEGMSEQTLARFKQREIVVSEGHRGQSSIHLEATTPLLMLFSITGIVLLIACANIANLLLARGANRAMEMAVRLSLGAGRVQLLGQLLTEAVLLALLGGVASLLVAKWTVGLINSFLPGDAAGVFTFRMDGTMLLFAAALSLGTGIVFGLFPALHSTRPDLIAMIRANTGQSGARSAVRFRTTLVTVQMGLAMTLLVMASLFVKSLANVSRQELGIRTENMVTFGVSPILNGYSRPRAMALFQQLEQELAALPGVSGVTAAIIPVLAGSSSGTGVNVEGFATTPDTDISARYNEVGPGFFRTMGGTLLAGREFNEADALGRPKVAIVNEAFARKFNLGRTPVGKHMAINARPGADSPLDVQIVGFIKDAKNSDVRDPAPPMFYTPYRQDSLVGYMQMYVRGSADEAMLLRTVPSVLKRIDPNLPMEEFKTMEAQIRENVFLDRMISTLSAAFALLATLLAAIGLYGVLAYTVAQRTREIGVRMALGADAGRVRAMVLKQVGVMTLIGGVVGILASIALSKLASSLLFGLQGSDPAAISAAALLLGLVALAAGGIPAMKAARVDPIRALRYE